MTVPEGVLVRSGGGGIGGSCQSNLAARTETQEANIFLLFSFPRSRCLRASPLHSTVILLYAGLLVAGSPFVVVYFHDNVAAAQ